LSLFQIDSGKEWRGGQRQSFFLARELQKKGYPFHFVVQPGSPLYRKCLEANIPVLPITIRGEFDVFATLKLAHAMKKKKCILAHFHDAHSVAVGSKAVSKAGVPLEVISRRVDFPIRSNPLSKRKYRKNIDSIIAISEGVRTALIISGINPDIIEVIPSGIDFSPFEAPKSRDYLRNELSFENDDYLVGVVAHLASHKGHKYLIEASRILKEKAPKIKIIIVGEGPLRMKLDKQAHETNVSEMVFFLGFREDIPQILASLDVFVLSSYLEGMGSSLLDAMASRLPVVATKVGGIPEVVINENTGLLVPARDSLSLAQAILRLYNDRTLAKRLGQRGYEVVHQKFSCRGMAEKIISLYERLAYKKGINLKKPGFLKRVE